MLKIKNYDKEKKIISFITDMNISLANAIRRSVLEIPVMAIDEVEIIKNDSALYDEILAHRIGLIPIKTNSVKETKFKLIETGPKMIVSGDFKPNTEAEEKLPIVLIEKEQEIEVIGNAKLGKGIEHAKYSPGLIYYKHNIDNKILDYVHINENGEISYDDEEINNKGLSEDQIKRIKLTRNNEELEFNVESWGQIEVKEIFLKAVEVLNDNLKELEKGIR
jgi:DNA-directed RNA polymerase subunit D